MAFLARVREMLARRDDVRWEEQPGGLFVYPPAPTGYWLVAVEGGDGPEVHIAAWHDHFSSEEAALEWFAFALRGEGLRVRVTSAGAFDYAWQLQILHGGQWKARSTTMRIPLPFWRQRHVRFLQNSAADVVAARGVGTADDAGDVGSTKALRLIVVAAAGAATAGILWTFVDQFTFRDGWALVNLICVLIVVGALARLAMRSLHARD
jgi:hypothetical protein